MDEELRSEFLIVARELFLKHRVPMSTRRLTELGLDEGLFSDRLAGRTPWQTMKAKLSVHIRRRGETSVFIRTAPGQFYLRELLGGAPPPYEAPPLRPPEAQERVAVIPVDVLDVVGRFQGILRDCGGHVDALLKSGHVRAVDRMEAERRDDVKQILTYVLVKRGTSVLAYKRGVFNRVEEMLRGARCLGFGGHVRDTDANLFSEDEAGVRESAVRELAEEIETARSDAAELSRRLEVVGLLNDDSSAVGRRHLAVVLACDVSDLESWMEPKRGEKSITQLGWIDPASNQPPLHDFEYWSQLCLRTYLGDAVAATPDFVIRRRSRLRPPNVLCVTGEIGSGKSEAVRVMANEFEYDVVNSGEVLAEVVGIPPVPETPRSEFHEAAWRFISHRRGPDRLASAIAKRITRDRPTVVDGLRQLRTLEALRERLDSRLGVIFVHTPPDMAYDLYCNREAKVVVPPLDFFALRDSPVEREVRDFIGIADAVVYNWVGRNSYHDAVRRLLTEIAARARR